eukprot:Ihof_evm12s85 gene=Ihof_evmTU12s85
MALLGMLEYSAYRLVRDAAEEHDTSDFHLIICACRHALDASSTMVTEELQQLIWLATGVYQLVKLQELTEKVIGNYDEKDRGALWNERGKHLDNIVAALNVVKPKEDTNAYNLLQKALNDIKALCVLHRLSKGDGVKDRKKFCKVLNAHFPESDDQSNVFYRESLMTIIEWKSFQNFVYEKVGTEGIETKAASLLTSLYPYKNTMLPRTIAALWSVCQELFSEPVLFRYDKEMNGAQKQSNGLYQEDAWASWPPPQWVSATDDDDREPINPKRQRLERGEDSAPNEILQRVKDEVKHIKITSVMLKRLYLELEGGGEKDWMNMLRTRDGQIQGYQKKTGHLTKQPQSMPRAHEQAAGPKVSNIVTNLNEKMDKLMETVRDPLQDIDTVREGQDKDIDQTRRVQAMFHDIGSDEGEQAVFTDSEDENPRHKLPDTSRHIAALDTKRDVKTRRTRQYWTDPEVEKLKKGVKEYGPGKWKR